MKLVGFEVNALHLVIADGASGWIFAPIQSAGDFQSFAWSSRRSDGRWFRSRAMARSQFDEIKENSGARFCYLLVRRKVTDSM